MHNERISRQSPYGDFTNGHHRGFRECKGEEDDMPKGYWVGRVDVIKPEGYQAYGVALAEVLRKYGAKFVVRAGTFEAVEGKARARNIVLEFRDYATALACYRSPEYAKAKALRAGAVDIDIIVIEGYEGPQPTD
jgi:uncharacterized protein (DUF1330 family)